MIQTVQSNYADSNRTVLTDFTNISVQKLKTSNVSGNFSAISLGEVYMMSRLKGYDDPTSNASDNFSVSSSISSWKELVSHSEGYDDPTSTKFNAPELPQANLFKRLWQRTDKEYVHQQLVVVPKPNSSMRDYGYSTRFTAGQSTVYSQVGSKIIAYTNKYSK